MPPLQSPKGPPNRITPMPPMRRMPELPSPKGRPPLVLFRPFPSLPCPPCPRPQAPKGRRIPAQGKALGKPDPPIVPQPCRGGTSPLRHPRPPLFHRPTPQKSRLPTLPNPLRFPSKQISSTPHDHPQGTSLAEPPPPRGVALHRRGHPGARARPQAQKGINYTQEAGWMGVREVRVANGAFHRPNWASLLMKSFLSKAKVNDYRRVFRNNFRPPIFRRALKWNPKR